MPRGSLFTKPGDRTPVRSDPHPPPTGRPLSAAELRVLSVALFGRPDALRTR